MEFSELGSGNIPTSGHIYISKNGSCSGNCNPTIVNSCGATLTGQSNVGASNTRASYFSKMPLAPNGNAISQNESAGEKVYEITMNQIGGFKAELQNVSGRSV